MNIILALVWTHFVADFVFQSDWMAQNKSHDFKALLAHIGLYTLFLIPFGWQYALINGIGHMAVDAISSQVNAYHWREKKIHAFFVGVGMDQAVHMSMLLWTIPLMR